MYADLDPQLHDAVLRAFGWRPELTGGQPHRIDDLTEWHRVSRGDRTAQFEAIVNTIADFMYEVEQHHAETGSYDLPIATHPNDVTDDGNYISLPYQYAVFDIVTAYHHRPDHTATLATSFDPRVDSSRTRMLRRLGTEDPRLLELKYQLGGSFTGDLDAKHVFGYSTEWCIRQSALAEWVPGRLWANYALHDLEPDGAYLQDIQADLALHGQATDLNSSAQVDALDRLAADLIERYMKSRRAGMSHDLAMHAYNSPDLDAVISLYTTAGPEYVLATLPERYEAAAGAYR